MVKSTETINTEMIERKKSAVKKARRQSVYKANEIVQTKRFELSTLEQKIVAYMVSLIDGEQKELEHVDASITDLCILMGINSNSGKNIETLKSTIRKLANKSEWAKIERNGERCETLVRWIEKPTFYYKSGIVRLKLDEDLKPYLIGLMNRYTRYDLENILAMKSKYGIRLFELCKSWEGRGYFETTLENLRELFAVEGYAEWYEFKRNVLDVSVSEINRLTDINVFWKTKKTGRNISKIAFTVQTKSGFNQVKDLQSTRGKLLDRHLDDEAQQLSFDFEAANDPQTEDFHDTYADALPLTETEKHVVSRMFGEIAEKKSAGKKAN